MNKCYSSYILLNSFCNHIYEYQQQSPRFLPTFVLANVPRVDYPHSEQPRPRRLSYHSIDPQGREVWFTMWDLFLQRNFRTGTAETAVSVCPRLYSNSQEFGDFF